MWQRCLYLEPPQEKAQKLAVTHNVKAVVIKPSCWTESK
jgi:hypothetical protein